MPNIKPWSRRHGVPSVLATSLLQVSAVADEPARHAASR